MLGIRLPLSSAMPDSLMVRWQASAARQQSMDMSTLRRLDAKHRPLIVTPLGNDAILRRSIPGVRVASADWWQRIDIGKDGEAAIVPAYHWSSRTGRDRRMALWSGFMLT